MALLTSRSPAFRLVAPPLAVIALLLSAWAWIVMPARQQAPTLDAAAATTAQQAAVAGVSDAPAANAKQTTADPAAATTPPATAAKLPMIRPRAGTVGPVKLGMRAEEAGTALGEQLIDVQRATARSNHFQSIAPKAGLMVAGTKGVVDTITVTNSGEAARRWQTPQGLAISSRSKLVTRAHPGAQRICGREYWVQDGRSSVRYAGVNRITSITVSTEPPPLFVPCT